MSRGFGELEPIQEAIPESLAVVVALLTQLGDVWFLALLLTGLYVSGLARRQDIATVGGLWLAGLGLYNGLKEFFQFPRPDQPLADPAALPELIQPIYEATAMAGGYGFPSGHAVNSTVVYVALAAVLTVSTRRRRFAAAAAIVSTVCFTRLALGVHYLVDVLAGVSAGLLLLGVAATLIDREVADRPSVAFGIAIPLAVFFVLTSGANTESLLVLVASVGGFVGWRQFGPDRG